MIKLTEYQKGYIHCLCNVVSKRCKKITDDLDEILYDTLATEEEFVEVITPIADQYGVKVYIEHRIDEFILYGEASVLSVTADGKREQVEIKSKDGKRVFEYPTFSLMLYKKDEDLKAYLELMKNTSMPSAEAHRALGELFGYAHEEIEEFIENFDFINQTRTLIIEKEL